MKKTLLLLTITIFANQLFATHYNQTGSINQNEAKYIITSKVLSQEETIKSGVEIMVLSGMEKLKSRLIKKDLAEYIGASGRTHEIADMFAMYEKRALSMGEQDLYFVSNHDVDVFVIVDKKGKNYTIDIYTGEDALLKKEELKK